MLKINGYTFDYTYTQESGTGFFVGTGDKSDALEDANELRQIVNDLGTLLGHSKMDGTYPKDLTTGGSLSVLANYYLKTAIDTIGEVETIWSKDITDSTELATALTDYYLKTAIDSQGEMETIWSVTLATDAELAALTYSDVGAIQDSTDTIKDTHIDWGVGANQVSTDDVTEGSTNKYFPGFTSLLVDYTFTDNSTNWNTAFGWGDHSTEGYLKTITGESIGDLSDVDLTDLADNKILKYNSITSKFECEDESGGGASTFLDLTDTPANYTDQAGKYVKVNAGETALEYGTPEGAGTVTTSGTPEVNDIARFTGATVIEGLTYDELTTALALNSDDLSDVASIAMLDENETVTSTWMFTYMMALLRESDADSPYFEFMRKRDGDPSYNILNGDKLGEIRFMAWHTDYWMRGATIRAVVDGTPGYGDIPTRLEFSTSPDGMEDDKLRMAIDNAGNIKMGDGAWTNYVKVTAGGAMTAEGTASIKATDLVFTNALASDHTYSGELDSQPVGESVVFGDLLYFDWTDKEWKKTDADASTTMPGLRIALETKADGETCLMLVKGYIRDDSAFEFAGAMIYASVTPGATSSTAPTATGDQVQRIGVAKSADILFFNPSIDVGEI